ncbi:MAG: calmodulin-binding protein [Pirellulales bacterium]
MIRIAACAVLLVIGLSVTAQAQYPSQPTFYGRSGGGMSASDWDRFYHYPYVYYPQNFRGQDFYRSAESLYFRYPSEMRIPVYNKKWYNYYPTCRLYHSGHHFELDVF